MDAWRRTLGVYPDMGLDGAHEPAGARATRRSPQEAMERSVRAAATRPDPGRAARTKKPLAAAVALAVLAVVGAYAGMKLYDRSGGAERDPQGARAAPAESASASTPPEPADAKDAGTPGDTQASIPAMESVSQPSTSPALPSNAPATPAPQTTAATVLHRAPAAASPHAPFGSESWRDQARHDVARALLTSDVVEREPTTRSAEIRGERGNVGRVFFYTEVRGLSGQQLRYRWERDGHLEAEMPMQVGTSWRWRTYSRKDLLPDQTGEWRVQLLDEADRVLAEATFVYRTDPADAQSADAN
jgi:hypothetical protein